MRHLILTASAAAAVATWLLACGDNNTQYGYSDGLQWQKLPPTSGGGGAGGGGGGGNAGGGGGGGGSDAGSNDEGGGGGCAGDVDGGSCGYSWKKDIFPMLTSTNWHCANAGCHNATGLDPKIDPTSECTTYANFAKYSCSFCTGAANGKPMVVAGDSNAADAVFLCVMQGTCGQLMPQGGPAVPSQDLNKLQTWIGCGMPEN